MNRKSNLDGKSSSKVQLLILPQQIPFTQRAFTYRELHENDVSMMFIALTRNAKHIAKHLDWVGDLESIGYQGARNLINTFLLDPERHHYLFFLGGKFVGHGLLAPVGEIPEHTQVILWVVEKCTGMGIGKRITKVLEEIAFDEYGYEALFYGFDSNNLASAEIAKSLQFFPHCQREIEARTPHNSGVWDCRYKENPRLVSGLLT
jgi:RimJ/RimL family protein N-acetyltransferase